MKKVKFLHFADIHLDNAFPSLGYEDDKSTIRRSDLKETFTRIIDIAKREAVDVLLIGGDLYEHKFIRKSTINFINNRFAELSNTTVFIVAGNHDPGISNSYYKSFKWNSNVYILSGDCPDVVIEDMGVCVHGRGFGNFIEDRSLLEEFVPADKQYINILLVHGTVDIDLGSSNYNSMSSSFLAKLNMDYIALGHFHNKMEDVGGYGVIYNPGSPEPMGFDEEGEHGIFLGSIEKKGTDKSSLNIKSIKTNKRFYQDISVNVSGCNTDEQVIDRINETVGFDEGHKKEDIIRVVLKGRIESGINIDTKHVQAFLKGKAFFVKIEDETSIDYNYEEIRKEPGLKGRFTDRLRVEIEECHDADEKKKLQKALDYGIEALDSGRIDIS